MPVLSVRRVRAHLLAFVPPAMDKIEAAAALRIGKAVRAARAKLGWSQAFLAERVDSSVEFVSLLERGERLPSIGMLLKLARSLGVTGGMLLGDEALPNPDRGDELALLLAVPEAARLAVEGMLKGVAEAYRRKAGRRK